MTRQELSNAQAEDHATSALHYLEVADQIDEDAGLKVSYHLEAITHALLALAHTVDTRNLGLGADS